MLPHRPETQTPLIAQEAIPHPTEPIGVYIHVPFCRKACHYCDFYFSVRQSQMEDYVQALLSEISAWQPWLSAQAVRTVYLGGGTPSWLPPHLLEKILSTLRAHARWQPIEITLEANPEDITRQNLHFWQALGINRLSLGVQSFSDDILHLLGRKASASRTKKAIEEIKQADWANWSVDLIFAVPGQTIQGLEAELRYLSEVVQVPHISLYGLTIEPRTVLYKKYRRRQFEGIDDEIYAEMYLFIHDFLASYGYEHYEISNWAKPGVYGQHNLGYWEGRPYIGLGPSAHSYIFPYRWWNRPDLKFYVSRLGSVQGAGQVEGELIMPEMATLEWFILHFRLSREIPWAVMPLPQKSFSQFRALAETWAERGWVRLFAEGMQLLPLGWLWLDTLLAEVFDLLTYAA